MTATSPLFFPRIRVCHRRSPISVEFWTAEAYDAVRLLAKTINDCGEDPVKVKECLYKIQNYPGVSAPITIDENGDGVREYMIKRVVDGKGVEE